MDFLLAPLMWFSDRLRARQQQKRRVLALVHRAYFQPPSTDRREHFFMKVTNLSPGREIELTHTWFATEPRVDLLNPARPLPARLKHDETYETWIPVEAVPDVPRVERLGRVRLSNTDVVRSRLNKDVPPVGYVGGGGSR